ncbi:MAG: DsbA family oxidoreductase [Paracoccaceae bacterium]
MVKLDILSDPICPWCYIGKANLARALDARPAHPFQIEWHPFQLNPDTPPEGYDREAYLAARIGDPERLAAMNASLREAARAAGLDFDPAKAKRIPNTLDAHRLIHWAGLEGLQDAAVSALFEANFVHGHDISDHDVLVDIARAIGMDPEVARRLLASDADADDIRARDAHSRSRGVTGVPTFIIDHRQAVSGAQPTHLWEQIIDAILAEQDE